MPEGAGGEEEEGHDELDSEHAGAGGAVEPGGELVRVRGERGGQGLGFVVKRESGEVAPREIAAEEFDGAGEQHQAEEQPDQEQAGETGRFVRRGVPEWDETPGGEKNGEEGGFEEERVPLEVEKNLAGAAEGEVTGPESEEGGGGGDAGEEEERESDAGGAEGGECGGAGADEPAERRELVAGFGGAELAEHGVEERLRRKQAVRSDQAGELGPRGGERNEVDDGEEAEEERRREGKTGRGGAHRIRAANKSDATRRNRSRRDRGPAHGAITGGTRS